MTRDGAATRRIILEEARKLFSVHGYNGIGIAALGKAAGITGAAVLHHFGSKENLLFEALVEEADKPVEWFQQKITNGLDLPTLLIDAARGMEAEPTNARLYLRLLGDNLAEENPAHDWFVRRYSNGRKLVADALREGQQEGRIAVAAPVEAIAREAFAVLDGLLAQWLLDPSPGELVAGMTRYADALRRELEP